MRLYSTNGQSPDASLKEAVLSGLAPDGGLYMPYEIPELPADFFEALPGMTFGEMAFIVLGALIGDDVPEPVLKEIANDAFDFEAPLVEVEPGVFCLELFHGPTLAFKDFGARFMARLMSHFVARDTRNLRILVATSGDTGSAVASGFYNQPNIQVSILYPSGRVSKIQEQQLTTMGGNVEALEVQGSFDDCQRMVKEAFVDPELQERLFLSSANSINIARLLPQSLYYFWAYAQQPKAHRIVVPSGNFGNLMGGFIAKRMGLPVGQFVAATNINDMVPQYLKTGDFKPRPFSKPTLSNAMDVGTPSNVARMMEFYPTVDELREDLEGCSFTDEETLATMADVFERTGYILDPHGAVAYRGLQGQPGIFLETAHPAKFGEVVQDAIGQEAPMPERLAAYLEREAHSIKLAPELDALKAHLLS